MVSRWRWLNRVGRLGQRQSNRSRQGYFAGAACSGGMVEVGAEAQFDLIVTLLDLFLARLARSGTCAPITPMFGCNDILQDDGREVTLCLD